MAKGEYSVMSNPAQKGRVLIVDDDDLVREVLASALQLDNWATCEAQNGKEALEKIKEESFDVMILDERMPEMTGREVYQYLVKNEIHMPVVLVTAASEIAEIAAELGIAFFLAKPVSFAELNEAVQRAAAGEYGRSS